MAWETEQRKLDPERVLAGVSSLLENPARGTYYVAEASEAGQTVIAGQLLITHEWSDWRNGDFWWIQSVYVADPYRSRKFFALCISTCMNWRANKRMSAYPPVYGCA